MHRRKEVVVANIPECLTSVPQWVCWKYVNRNGIETKLPIEAKSLQAANVVDPACWTSFENAMTTFKEIPSLDGVAFAFSDLDPFAGVDLDDCLDDQGNFTWGEDVVSGLDSYAEISPSGSGVKIFLRGRKPASSQCRVDGLGPNAIGKLEVYDRARCFAVTGRRLPSSPVDVMDRQEKLDSLCHHYWPPKPASGLITPTLALPVSPLATPLPSSSHACLRAMTNMHVVDHSDGSHRLFAACCRCVEYDLSDSCAVQVIRQYEAVAPFPLQWSDGEIYKRLRSAERKVQRGVSVDRRPLIQPAPLSVVQLVNDHPELRPPLIHGLLRTGETMNVIAPPKFKKSWLVIDLALALATGRPWLDTFATEQSQVLILDNELHRETSANRIPKVAEARNIDLASVADRLFVDNLRGRLLDINSMQAYFDSLRRGFFRLVVLDAFYRFLPKDADENSNSNLTDFYNRLDAYASMLDCSFILVHHASKGNQSGKSVTDVGAGAGSQARATDTHLVLRQHEEDDCVVVDAAVRSWHPIDPICMRWTFPVWNVEPSLDPNALRTERPRRKAKSKEEPDDVEPQWTPVGFVEAFLTNEPATTKTILALAKQSNLSQRLAKDLLIRAEDAGLAFRWTFGATRPVKFASIIQPNLVPD
ncbi:MAG: AAA family ATPase [Pirellula sp.]